MKLVTYSRNQTISCGILANESVIDIPSIWQGPKLARRNKLSEGGPPRSVIEILQRGPDCLAQLTELVESTDIVTPLEQVKILAPIPRPGKIIALAGNYSEHIKEVGRALGLSDPATPEATPAASSPRQTTVPRPFIMPATVVIGPDEEIPWPAYSEQIDYELELAVVIGKKAKYVEPENALEYVAGYTICNDVSARSVTFKKNRATRPWDEFYDWLNGKWADGFLPMGPYLLTSDEISDVQNLKMELKVYPVRNPKTLSIKRHNVPGISNGVNSEVRQKANTSQMIYTVADIVSFLSHLMTLEPGDIIATGTPSGVAMATGRFLQLGDKIECTIENLGTLTNTLGRKPEKFFEPLVE